MLPLDLILLDPALDGQRMLDAAAWGNVPGPDFNIRAWLRQHEVKLADMETSGPFPVWHRERRVHKHENGRFGSRP